MYARGIKLRNSSGGTSGLRFFSAFLDHLVVLSQEGVIEYHIAVPLVSRHSLTHDVSGHI